MFRPYSHYTYPHRIHLCSYAEYNTLIQMGATCTRTCWVPVRQSFNFSILRCITYFRIAICVQILPSPAYSLLICLSLGLKGFPMDWGVHFSTLISCHTNLRAHRNSGAIQECRNHTICLIYSYQAHLPQLKDLCAAGSLDTPKGGVWEGMPTTIFLLLYFSFIVV